jgi:hypothetical protein
MLRKFIFILISTALFFSANAQPEGISNISKKCSPTLAQFILSKEDHAGNNTHLNNYKLVCTNNSELLAVYKDVGAAPSIKQYFPEHHFYVLQISDPALLRKILKLPSVLYADLYHPPKEELEVGNYDPSLNCINVLHQKYPLANGTGFTVSIKENNFDTLDIDFRGRYVSSGNASAQVTGHASIMATLVGGGGNTASGSLGVAPGANLSSSTFANLLPDATTQLQQLSITVQNHSYGTVVENFYGAEARAYDQQLNALPAMAHVFSAGNSGTATPTTGLYAGVAGVANLTGNFKAAKNIITVGATDSFSRVLAAISKGPAYDGRMKPDITAFAEDGSSGAAAIVSGTITRLQHLYKQLNGGLPPTALLKAILYNSADDVGAAGVDFSSGFGSLNAYRAAGNIANGRYFSGSTSQGNFQTFPVTIPAGIQTAKFTLVWNDPATSLLAAKALVNDLDLTVTRLSDNFVYQPWVLNHFPHPDSLQQLPRRKKDTLNNAEQVGMDNPAPGNYTIKIDGASIPTGSQSFYIAYQFDTMAYFEFTHPFKGDYLQGGIPNTIRWQNTIAGNGTLQYSYDNTNWNTINTNIPLGTGYYIWDAPDTMNTARLKMITALGNITGDTFVISTPPIVETGYNCPAEFLLWWKKPKNTAVYEVYRLGAKYMEPFAIVSDTIAFFSKTAQPALHYAIRPMLLNGIPAQRSFAYNYTTQGVNCYFRSFLGDVLGNQAQLTLELGSIIGIQNIFLEKQSGNGFITLQQVPVGNQLSYQFTDNALKTGLNVYRVRIVRTNGEAFYSDPVILYFFGKQPYLLFPNPVAYNGSFSIVTSQLKNVELRLYNMNGQPVLKYKTRQYNEEVSVAGIASGVYFYTIIEDGQTVQSGKLVVY